MRVAAFRGLRFDPRKVRPEAFLCPPYDIIEDRTAARLRRRRANAIQVELPGRIGKETYRGAARTWRKWLASCLLVRDPEPSLYLCEERFLWKGRRATRLGVLAALALERGRPRGILPHEKTYAKPKEDRLRQLRALRANTSPIFCVFADPGGRVLRGLANSRRHAIRAASGSAPGGTRFVLWRLSRRADVRRLCRTLSRKVLLIADGHHRYEVARRYFRTARGGVSAASPSTSVPRSGAARANGAGLLLAYLAPDQKGLVVLPGPGLAGGWGRLGPGRPLDVPRILREVGERGLLPQKSTYFYPKVMTGLVFRSLE